MFRVGQGQLVQRLDNREDDLKINGSKAFNVSFSYSGSIEIETSLLEDRPVPNMAARQITFYHVEYGIASSLMNCYAF